jgi:hypothetical protein
MITGLAGLLASAGACGEAGSDGPAIEVWCNKLSQCVEQSGGEYSAEECVKEQEQARTSYAEAGCGAEFDAAMACNASAYECGGITTPCSEETNAAFQCNDEPCDDMRAQMDARINECGSTSVYPDPWGSCDSATLEQLKCYRACFDGAACEAITGDDGAGEEKLQQCVWDCD